MGKVRQAWGVLRGSTCWEEVNNSYLDGVNPMCPVVKNLLREWKWDVICLQEMKITNVSKEIVRSSFIYLFIFLTSKIRSV